MSSRVGSTLLPCQCMLTCDIPMNRNDNAGQSEWKEVGPFYKAHTPLPGAGGVGPRESYTWKQDADELEVTILLPPGGGGGSGGGGGGSGVGARKLVTAKQLNVEIRTSSIKVELLAGNNGGGGDGSSSLLLLEGTLQHEVERMGDGSFWELQTESPSSSISGGGGRARATQSLLITLAKKQEKAGTKEQVNNQLWTVLIAGHPEVDLRQMKERDQKLFEEVMMRGENADLVQQMASLPSDAKFADDP